MESTLLLLYELHIVIHQVNPSSKDEENANKLKKMGKCSYSKKCGHYISECKKRIAKEREKESNMSFEDSSLVHVNKDDALGNLLDTFDTCGMMHLTILPRSI